MNIIKLLILVILCTSGFELLSASIPFRLGQFLSAEISRNKVTIKNFDSADYDLKLKHYAYALVTFKLDKGRSVSVYDFKLKFKGEQYKCIAIRSGTKAFNTKNWRFSKTSPQTIYSFLFIINSEDLGNAKKTISAKLLYTLNSSGKVSYELPFKFVNYSNLTKVNKIPIDGTFPKVEIITKKVVPDTKIKTEKTLPESSNK